MQENLAVPLPGGGLWTVVWRNSGICQRVGVDNVAMPLLVVGQFGVE